MNIQYLQMCRASKEIQEAWVPKIGDRVLRQEEESATVLTLCKIEDILLCNVTPFERDLYPNAIYKDKIFRTFDVIADLGVADVRKLIFLPSQGQIQKMFDLYPYSILLLEKFFGFCKDQTVIIKLQDFDAAWVAFYMYYIHNKVWKDKKWEPGK